MLAESVRAGRVLDMASEPTLSDGTAGGVEADTITLEPCRRLVDDWILVPEKAIRTEMARFHALHQMRVEGAAGVALAAYVADTSRNAADNSVVIICGGNVADDAIEEWSATPG